jgi:hypothetical protein
VGAGVGVGVGVGVAPPEALNAAMSHGEVRVRLS